PGSTESHVELMTSPDHGRSWTGPTRLDTGVNSTFAPRLVAGRRGNVDVVFYGTQAHDETDPAARWGVYVDQVMPVGSAHPDVLQSLVDPDVHVGAICPQGTTSGGN